MDPQSPARGIQPLFPPPGPLAGADGWIWPSSSRGGFRRRPGRETAGGRGAIPARREATTGFGAARSPPGKVGRGRWILPPPLPLTAPVGAGLALPRDRGTTGAGSPAKKESGGGVAFSRRRRRPLLVVGFQTPCVPDRVRGDAAALHPTRLETRTKESGVRASQRVVRNPRAQ